MLQCESLTHHNTALLQDVPGIVDDEGLVGLGVLVLGQVQLEGDGEDLFWPGEEANLSQHLSPQFPGVRVQAVLVIKQLLHDVVQRGLDVVLGQLPLDVLLPTVGDHDGVIAG